MSSGRPPRVAFRPDPVDGHESLVTLSDGSQVMMEWERPYMEACVEALAIRPGRDAVLEIGFGLGFSAARIQDQRPRRHTIIECDPAVLLRLRAWASTRPSVSIVQGTWQDAMGLCGRREEGVGSVRAGASADGGADGGAGGGGATSLASPTLPGAPFDCAFFDDYDFTVNQDPVCDPVCDPVSSLAGGTSNGADEGGGEGEGIRSSHVHDTTDDGTTGTAGNDTTLTISERDTTAPLTESRWHQFIPRLLLGGYAAPGCRVTGYMASRLDVRFPGCTLSLTPFPVVAPAHCRYWPQDRDHAIVPLLEVQGAADGGDGESKEGTSLCGGTVGTGGARSGEGRKRRRPGAKELEEESEGMQPWAGMKMMKGDEGCGDGNDEDERRGAEVESSGRGGEYRRRLQRLLASKAHLSEGGIESGMGGDEGGGGGGGGGGGDGEGGKGSEGGTLSRGDGEFGAGSDGNDGNDGKSLAGGGEAYTHNNGVLGELRTKLRSRRNASEYM